MFISSKIIVNNNFQIIKNDNHESFYIFFQKLNENYNIQQNNIEKEELCIEIKDRKVDRHHLRWVFEGFRISMLKNVYLKFQSKKILNYFFTFSIFFTLLFTFIFSLMTSCMMSNKKLSELNEKNMLVIFFSYISFLSLYSFREVSEIRFSVYEMLILSACIYCAVRKLFLLYVITCVLAVLNRESGIILVSIWFLLNTDYLTQKKIFSKNNIKNFILSLCALVITLLIFIYVNKNIFNCGFIPQLFMHVDVDDTRIFEQNLFSFRSLNSFITNFLLVFFFIYFFWYRGKNQIKISLVIVIYSLIFLFFTPIDHYILRIIYLPLITTYICNYLFEQDDLKKNI
jgi:hypothetical protein